MTTKLTSERRATVTGEPMTVPGTESRGPDHVAGHGHLGLALLVVLVTALTIVVGWRDDLPGHGRAEAVAQHSLAGAPRTVRVAVPGTSAEAANALARAPRTVRVAVPGTSAEAANALARAPRFLDDVTPRRVPHVRVRPGRLAPGVGRGVLGRASADPLVAPTSLKPGLGSLRGT